MQVFSCYCHCNSPELVHRTSTAFITRTKLFQNLLVWTKTHSLVTVGPQDSVLVLLYSHGLCYHCYADDSQLFSSLPYLTLRWRHESLLTWQIAWSGPPAAQPGTDAHNASHHNNTVAMSAWAVTVNDELLLFANMAAAAL